MSLVSRCFARRTAASAVLCLSALAACLTPAGAAEVVLRMKGGGLEIKGELKAFDGLAYTIEEPTLGTISFDAARVECQGDACARRMTAALAVERLDPASPDAFTIAGAPALATTLMPALIRAYAESLGASATLVLATAPGEQRYRIEDARGSILATVTLQQGTSSAAFAALARGGAAIALADRRMSEEERQAVLRTLPGFRNEAHERAIATDALAVIVSPQNRSVSLSGELLAKVLSGQIAHWVDLGVSGGRIAIYGADRAGALATAEATLLKPRGLTLAASITELASEVEVADRVARDANAIGVISRALERNARHVNVVGACGVVTRPTPFAVKAGEYAMTRPLYIYSAGSLEQPAARGLMRFALSPAAQRLVAEAGLVDAAEEIALADGEKGRLAAAVNAPAQAFDMELLRRLLAETKSARRLSLTFRFQPGTVELDAAGRQQVGDLAQLLQSPEWADRSITLIGYTDQIGQLPVNVQASVKRATQVRTAVLKAGQGRIPESRIAVAGYGPLAPVACQDVPEARQLNRRVEVWVQDRQP